MKSKPLTGLPAFHQPDLLEQAFVHRSLLNEQNRWHESNERLEFLGDAVLELVTSAYLYHRFPDVPEGKLTRFRSQIVQTQTLAWIARRLGLNTRIRLSKGEKESGGSDNPSILADTLEAVIGAVFLDQGLPAAREFIHRELLDRYFANEAIAPRDYKSLLQEKVQAQNKPSPVYRVIEESGPDHHKQFTVSAEVGGTPYAVGQGPSKQKAEQDAARLALEKCR